MGRRAGGLPAGVRVSDQISLGVIAKTFPRERVDQVLRDTQTASQRQRDLPAHVVVYYVIALALYMGVGTTEVLRCLLEGLRLLWGATAVRVAGKSAISQARTRLGETPLRQLYEQVVQPLAQQASRGAWYRQWRLISLDGSCLDVPDTLANRAGFGSPGSTRGASAYPQLRFVSLLENGTHVLFGARLGRYNDSETTLARDVMGALRPGFLCLADRQFLATGCGATPRPPGRICSGGSRLAFGCRAKRRWRMARLCRRSTPPRSIASARRAASQCGWWSITCMAWPERSRCTG